MNKTVAYIQGVAGSKCKKFDDTQKFHLGQQGGPSVTTLHCPTGLFKMWQLDH